jgi:PAS domain S-box-containing protein/diguanylate cyclase (GGDEF)-like protein
MVADTGGGTPQRRRRDLRAQGAPVTSAVGPAASSALSAWSERSLLEALIGHSKEAVRVIDREGIVRLWNAASEALYGWTASEALGRPQLSVSAASLEESQQLLARVLDGGRVLDLVVTRQHKVGRQVDVLVSAVPLYDESGNVRAALDISSVASPQSASSSTSNRQLRVDPITGFESRSWFFEQMIDYLSTSRRTAGFVRLEVVELPAISDGYGYEVGDDIAALFADRMRGALRDVDVVARFGSNEFALFLPGVDVAGIRRVVTRVFADLEAPFLVADRSFRLQAWAGGVTCDSDARVGELVRVAGSALDTAKQSVDGGLFVFDEHERTAVVERVRLEADFRAGSAEGNLTLEYQPIVDTSTGSISGVEALVRWNHPELGPLEPAQFLPVAELSGEIVALGRWVVREACRQLSVWHEQFPDHSLLVMSVNLSTPQLRDPGIAVDIAAAIKETSIEPGDLQLEVPQSVLSDDGVYAALREISALGVRLAIDDFGMGSSSFTMLRNLPFATVKIAQSVVAGLATSGEDRAIAMSIVTLAEHLGLNCVGVGVENTEQFDFLTYHGCDKAQGFFVSRPLSAADMTTLLRNPDVLG